MFGISGFELMIILAFALLIFGPDKLPQMGRTIGRFMAEFKRMQSSMEQQIRAEIYKSGLPMDGDFTAAEAPKSSAASAAATDDEEEEEEEE
ncbi:MAG: twin-arginine translocase TatA/TatE family subunit [Coriobacteriia bacterium]|nr:twin-arginine translocase TatA/TatE family subunit [Coriobacteriia bacterium]